MPSGMVTKCFSGIATSFQILILWLAYSPGPPNALALSAEVRSMLKKNALEVVDDWSAAFYSWLCG